MNVKDVIEALTPVGVLAGLVVTVMTGRANRLLAVEAARLAAEVARRAALQADYDNAVKERETAKAEARAAEEAERAARADAKRAQQVIDDEHALWRAQGTSFAEQYARVCREARANRTDGPNGADGEKT